jgi:hypothetical protein
MQSLDYPGTPAMQPGVLAPDGGWSPLPGGEPPDELVVGRTCVLAVGSNASPAVLRAKLARAGVAEPVALVPCVVHGLDVAHSAHVSLGGYLPVTPCRRPLRVRPALPVVASWFGHLALAALDATEPNYQRLSLPDDTNGAPPGAQVYVSRWGVLARDGQPVHPRPQVELHALLRTDPQLAALLSSTDPAATVAALQEPEVRSAVNARLQSPAWSAATGLPG